MSLNNAFDFIISFNSRCNIHVWEIDLKYSSLDVEYLSYLSPDEKLKVKNFIFKKDKVRYIRSHGSLRVILSRYLNVMPHLIEYKTSIYGKPFLSEKHDSKLQFNMSHTNDIAFVALHKSYPLGIDLEWLKPNFANMALAESIFSAYEMNKLQQLSKVDFEHAFFRCWSRKEALIKAVGLGLSCPLKSFDVEVELKDSLILVESRFPKIKAKDWQVIDIDAPDHHFSSLALGSNLDGYTIHQIKYLHVD